MNNESDYSLELTRANRLRIGRAFRFNRRVDMSINCVVEGQMGAAFVDDPEHPSAFRITVGPFWYFAGDAEVPAARQMMSQFPTYNLLMPSPGKWSDLAKELFGERLRINTRHQFSGTSLSAEHLLALRKGSGWMSRVVAIDAALAARLANQPDSYFDYSDFESAEDFAARGLGFCALDGDTVMGVAYSSLVCSRGIEISIFVNEAFRRRGVATALAASLVLSSLELGLEANWDAANPESAQLATKLGYTAVGPYDAYYYVSTG